MAVLCHKEKEEYGLHLGVLLRCLNQSCWLIGKCSRSGMGDVWGQRACLKNIDLGHLPGRPTKHRQVNLKWIKEEGDNKLYWDTETVTRWVGSKRTLPHEPQFLVRTQRSIWGLTHGKTSLLKKEQKGEVGQGQRGTRMMKYGASKKGLLHIHLGGCGCGLTVLIDSCNLTAGSIVHCFPIIQPVIIRCMYV